MVNITSLLIRDATGIGRYNPERDQHDQPWAWGGPDFSAQMQCLQEGFSPLLSLKWAGLCLVSTHWILMKPQVVARSQKSPIVASKSASHMISRLTWQPIVLCVHTFQHSRLTRPHQRPTQELLGCKPAPIISPKPFSFSLPPLSQREAAPEQCHHCQAHLSTAKLYCFCMPWGSWHADSIALGTLL